MITIARRTLVKGLGAIGLLAAAPSIVRAQSLMPVSAGTWTLTAFLQDEIESFVFRNSLTDEWISLDRLAARRLDLQAVAGAMRKAHGGRIVIPGQFVDGYHSNAWVGWGGPGTSSIDEHIKAQPSPASAGLR